MDASCGRRKLKMIASSSTASTAPGQRKKTVRYVFLRSLPRLMVDVSVFQLRLVDQDSTQEMRNVLYRYDPPVLIVGATWHEKPVAYVESLYRDLQQVYVGHEDNVCIRTFHRALARLLI